MFKLDKNTIADFEKKWVQRVKVYFISGGCSGTKIDIVVDDFDINEDIEKISQEFLDPSLQQENGFQVFVEKKDFEKFQDATITRLVKADHTGEAKPRYIYSNEAILDRCGCGTSFSFEKKKPKD